MLKSEQKGVQRQAKAFFYPNKFGVCCTLWLWSEPAHSDFQNSATLELHSHFPSWRQFSKHWLIWERNNHVHSHWESIFFSSSLCSVHCLIAISKNLGTPEICLPKPFPSTALIVWFMFWQHPSNSAQLSKEYFSHICIFPIWWFTKKLGRNISQPK